MLFIFACEAAGASRARHSLRPLYRRRRTTASLGRFAPRECRGVISEWLSRTAKAAWFFREGKACPTAGERLLFLTEQNRVRTVHSLRTVHHRSLKGGGMHGDVLRKETRQRNVAHVIAVARGKRFAGKHAAPKRRSEQLEIRSGAGERVIGRRGNPLQQPSAGAIQRSQGVPQFGAGGAEARIVRSFDAADYAREFVEQRPHGRATA